MRPWVRCAAEIGCWKRGLALNTSGEFGFGLLDCHRQPAVATGTTERIFQAVETELLGFSSEVLTKGEDSITAPQNRPSLTRCFQHVPDLRF